MTFHRKISFVCFGFLCLAQFLAFSHQAGAAFPDKSARLDWVCVTAPQLVDAYAPLAQQRLEQGLASRVLDLEEVLFWYPGASADTCGALRWLAQTAARQWGTRYLLLGGSHALLPAPLHHASDIHPPYSFPLDSFYACLDGQWDVDGDGLFAEWEDDAAEPAVHLALGRLPLDGVDEVAAAVAKIIRFESRSDSRLENGLVVSSLMNYPYVPGDPYPSASLQFAMDLVDSLSLWRPDLRVGSLFESPDGDVPLENELNIFALVDSLGARHHDLVFLQLNGINSAWEMARGMAVQGRNFDPLRDSGHLFLGAMLSGPVADSRDQINPGCVLADLLGMENGGAVAMCAPTGESLVYPQHIYQSALWRRLTDDTCLRMGDAHRAALTVMQEEIEAHQAFLSTFYFLSLAGDPATMLRPAAGTASGTPVVGINNLRSVPNPFNPATSIRFDVGGTAGSLVPVKVEVFDLRGRHVSTAFDRLVEPGPRTVSWQPGDLPSGVYFARVTAAGRQLKVKLTLVK